MQSAKAAGALWIPWIAGPARLQLLAVDYSATLPRRPHHTAPCTLPLLDCCRCPDAAALRRACLPVGPEALRPPRSAACYTFLRFPLLPLSAVTVPLHLECAAYGWRSLPRLLRQWMRSTFLHAVQYGVAGYPLACMLLPVAWHGGKGREAHGICGPAARSCCMQAAAGCTRLATVQGSSVHLCWNADSAAPVDGLVGTLRTLAGRVARRQRRRGAWSLL